MQDVKCFFFLIIQCDQRLFSQEVVVMFIQLSELITKKKKKTL